MLLCLLLVAGCTRAERANRAQTSVERRPYTHLRFDNDPAQFHFAIVGDRTGRHRDGVFEKGLAKLNLLRPELVMSVGDLIEGYTQDEAEIDQEWDEIAGFTAKLDAPFFYVPGNHDLSNPVQQKKWRDRFGRSYYHFVYRNVLFLALNTYDPEQRISPEQIAYVAATLKENPGVRWTCVFMHEPLWDYKKPTGWADVEELLQDRPYTVFAGHYHTYTKYLRHDRRYIVLATTGGGMKDGLTGPELGSFDHITWVTMRPDGPLLANIELDAIHDEDVRTEAMADLINRVLRGEVMEISPVLTTRDKFDRADVALTVKNDSDVPMSASGTIPMVGALHVAPDTFDVSVPAKGQATVRAELRAEVPVVPSALAPLAVRWTATYAPPGRNPVRVPRVDRIAAERVADCPARATPVVVDGKLDEWTRFPFSAKAKDPKDCSYEFAVEHDVNFVYIAVKTTDDRAVLNSKKEPWSQDGVEVRFDARPDPLRSQGRGHGEFKDILVISQSPADKQGGERVLYSATELPPGVNAACAVTPTGHATEIAIPVSYLNERQGGGAWSGFRLNVTVDDFDAVAGPLKALWWRPDWRGGETFAGSGTFQRKD
jgi:hypothetical protein